MSRDEFEQRIRAIAPDMHVRWGQEGLPVASAPRMFSAAECSAVMAAINEFLGNPF